MRQSSAVIVKYLLKKCNHKAFKTSDKLIIRSWHKKMIMVRLSYG